MPRTLPFHTVDVFTAEPFAGNPLAVVLDTEGLPDDALQRIAREFNLSETAFPQRLTEGAAPGADYLLRIFTPALELPFAGHPSLGAAFVLGALGWVQPGRVVQRCGAGDLPLELRPDGVTLTGGTPDPGQVLDGAAFAAAVGLEAGDLAGPVRTAGTGNEWAYVPVRDRATVTRSKASAGALEALPCGVAYVVAWDPATSTAYARGWAGRLGITEDPATGSAALGLGVYLVAVGLLPASGESAYVVLQGVDMGRPSRLECTVVAHEGRAVRCTVAGSVVPVSSGTMLL